ncbi:MAG: hypothetical protein ACKVI3_10940 [Verrucomicrobiia bacterium]
MAWTGKSKPQGGGGGFENAEIVFVGQVTPVFSNLNAADNDRSQCGRMFKFVAIDAQESGRSCDP